MARTLEADILVPTLKALAARGSMNAAARLAHLRTVVPLSPEDGEVVEGGETRFARTVRDQVLRRHEVGNIVAEGYATYHIGIGLCITDKGRKLIAR